MSHLFKSALIALGLLAGSVQAAEEKPLWEIGAGLQPSVFRHIAVPIRPIIF